MGRLPIHRTLSFKLFAFIALLLVLTIAVNAALNSRQIYSTLMLQCQERTLVNARLTANGVDATLDSWSDQLGVIVGALSGVSRDKLHDVGMSFMQGHEFLTFELIAPGNSAAIVETRTRNLDDHRFEGKDAGDLLERIGAASREWIKREGDKKKDDASLRVTNLAAASGLPVVALAMPLTVTGETRRIWAVATVWQTKLIAALSAGDSDDVVVVDLQGRVLTGSTPAVLKGTLPLAGDVLFDAARSSDLPAGFKRWTGAQKNLILGAYGRTKHAGLLVLTRTNGRFAFDAARLLVVQSLLWAALLVLLSMLASLAAASSITRNLRLLAQTTVRIADGDFKAKAQIRSSDEVGLLGAAVNFMGRKLDELVVDRLEKARLEGELQTAKLVQDAFFPGDQRQIGHLSMVAQFKPASECGGDWWSHYEFSPAQHLICIGDATGHGVPAALVTAMVFAAASVLTRQIGSSRAARPSMAHFLAEINKTLFASGKGRHTMTFFAVFIDLDTGECIYSNAGHNFPHLLRHGGADLSGKTQWEKRMRVELRLTGAPLGYGENETFKDQTLQLAAGDRLIFFTDGLFECSNAKREQWGRRAFLRAMESSLHLGLADFKKEISQQAFGHFAGHPPDDDITLVVAEIDPAWVAKAERDAVIDPLSPVERAS